MTEQSGPLPRIPAPQRIGDRERDQAAEYLREHVAEGRLDQQEFDERLTVALTARTQADLDPLFLDLPSPKPGTMAPAQPLAAQQPWLSTGMVQQPWLPSSVVQRPAYPVRTPVRVYGGWALGSALLWPALIFFMIAFNSQHFPFALLMLPFLVPWVLGRSHRRGPRGR